MKALGGFAKKVTTQRNKVLAAAMGVIALACAVYVFQFRYYLRMVPVPLSAIDYVYGADGPAPRFTPRGRLDMPNFDLETEAGLRAALDHVRSLSPTAAVAGMTQYDNINFDKWVAQLRDRQMYCTDATLLFLLIARSQGLPAREWWMWTSAGWSGGQAHSLVEYFNPRLDRWQVVDPLTSTVIRDQDGAPVSMAEALRRSEQGRLETLRFDQSPRMQTIKNRASYDTRKLLFGGPRSPVINLKPPGWFATTPKTDLLIGIAVMTSDSRHDMRIYFTKVVLLLGAVCGVAAMVLVWRGRPRRRPASP